MDIVCLSMATGPHVQYSTCEPLILYRHASTVTHVSVCVSHPYLCATYGGVG